MPKKACAWISAVRDCLGCAGESGSQSLTQAAVRVPLSHQGQSSEESSSTPHCRMLSSKEGDLLSHVKVFSKEVARLNTDFSSIPRQWLVSGIGELLPTKLGREFNDVVVEEGSARCEDFLTVQENHISICQPGARNSTTYQHLSNFIGRVQQKFTSEPHSYPLSTLRGSQTYVPIHIQARDRIISGLEDEQGPAVILLHGDPGSGKSVLARFIGESYARSRGAADPGSIFLSVPRISPKLVIFLECGQTAVSTVLLQKLHEKLPPQVHRSQDQCGSGSMSTHPFLMMGRRIIVVLDDVWNAELIEAFLKEVRGCDGAHVKILVTSRRSDLSDDPEILKVKIEEVTYTEAENILAKHLGLTSIPQNLQEYVEILVDRSGRHPLALAMIAHRITRDRSEDPERWKAVAKRYPALLRQQLRAGLVRQGKQGMPFGSVFNCAYKMSIRETLMLTYKDLEPDARYLLLLIAKSGASSIPSPVVQILFAYGVANHHKHSEPELPRFALDDLENSGAMLRVSTIIEEGDVRCKALSFSVKAQAQSSVLYTSFGNEQFSYESLGLHDLQKEFLNVLMEEDNERLEKSLVPDSHCPVPRVDSGKMTSEELDRATVWILCVLWLRQDLAERAAAKLGVSLPLFGSLSIPVLRDALEPLTWLMHEDFDENMIRCAKQVIRLYSCILQNLTKMVGRSNYVGIVLHVFFDKQFESCVEFQA
ncbi:hypothetical protein R1sor_004153 [Riccia sorocarpa]|uniref:AAA+ ATPase domain-containing protein n=1 Tax=Riccia sorocarpa TaxID=122646 RepID=A0ABD3H5T7_9MARC